MLIVLKNSVHSSRKIQRRPLKSCLLLLTNPFYVKACRSSFSERYDPSLTRQPLTDIALLVFSSTEKKTHGSYRATYPPSTVYITRKT